MGKDVGCKINMIPTDSAGCVFSWDFSGLYGRIPLYGIPIQFREWSQRHNCPDGKDPRADIDYMLIWRESVRLTCNLNQSEGLCYLGAAAQCVMISFESPHQVDLKYARIVLEVDRCWRDRPYFCVILTHYIKRVGISVTLLLIWQWLPQPPMILEHGYLIKHLPARKSLGRNYTIMLLTKPPKNVSNYTPQEYMDMIIYPWPNSR